GGVEEAVLGDGRDPSAERDVGGEGMEGVRERGQLGIEIPERADATLERGLLVLEPHLGLALGVEDRLDEGLGVDAAGETAEVDRADVHQAPPGIRASGRTGPRTAPGPS